MPLVNSNNIIIAVTSGDPAGVGPDICLDILNMYLPCHVVIIGDKEVLRDRARILGKNFDVKDFNPHNISSTQVSVKHIPVLNKVNVGLLDKENVPYVISILDDALLGIKNNIYSAITTCPINKGIINAYGINFKGHTEFFSLNTNNTEVVMMLVGGGIRVALITTHIPISKVPKLITQELIIKKIKIINKELKAKFNILNPRISICGLNPHAGDLGSIGDEEILTIIPAIEKLKLQGINIEGPLSADTVFQKFSLNETDIIVAMYHDQGLPVLKYASFGKGVNVTLGLPFIRTSVDHGTALNIAGLGKADSSSLKSAIFLAYDMLKNNIKFK